VANVQRLQEKTAFVPFGGEHVSGLQHRQIVSISGCFKAKIQTGGKFCSSTKAEAEYLC
jgi:hypothetical protein